MSNGQNESNKATVVNVTNEPTEQSISSVEIKHTTKGDTWVVKVYNHDPVKARDDAIAIFEDLRQKYGGS